MNLFKKYDPELDYIDYTDPYITQLNKTNGEENGNLE